MVVSMQSKGDYVKVYLDAKEMAAMKLWQLRQAQEGDNQSRSHALKLGFRGLMIDRGIMRYNTTGKTMSLVLVDKPESESQPPTDSYPHESKRENDDQPQSERVRRVPGNDSAGPSHADGSRAGAPRTQDQSRRSRRLRRGRP